MKLSLPSGGGGGGGSGGERVGLLSGAAEPRDAKKSAAAAGPPPAAPLALSALADALLSLCAVALGAFAGVGVRVGFSYYDGRGLTTGGFTVLFAENVGCFVMGVASEFQARLTGAGSTRVEKLLYLFVTTGLCGSITTFSTWMLECSKLFVSGFDSLFPVVPVAPEDSPSTGELVGEYLVALWIGTSLPTAALVLGQHCAQAAAEAYAARAGGADAGTDADGDSRGRRGRGGCCGCVRDALLALWRLPEAAALALLVGAFAVATTALAAVAALSEYPAVAVAMLMGVPGAYLRFQLAPLNKATPLLLLPRRANDFLVSRADGGNFPIGTFVANMIGCLAQCGAVVAAKFVVSFHDKEAQALLYAVSVGFCGCLTTLSTFALELVRLPRASAYRYACLSNGVAQVLYTLLFGALGIVLAAGVARNEGTNLPKLDVCASFPTACGLMLDHVGCAAPHRIVQGCGPGGDLDSFAGACACGGLDAGGALSGLLVQAQAGGTVGGLVAYQWPVAADGSGGNYDEVEAVDFVSSFEDLCLYVLQRLACPAASRTADASDARRGLSAYAGRCACGAVDLAPRVEALITRFLLTRRYDILPYAGNLGAPAPVDVCAAAAALCGVFLDRVLCPATERTVAGCGAGSAPFSYASFSAACTCFGNVPLLDAGASVRGVLLQALTAPHVLPKVAVLNASTAAGSGALVVDACRSHDDVCAWLLGFIGCPAPLRRAGPVCSNLTAGAGPAPPGAALPPDAWDASAGGCACGALALEADVRNWLVSAASAEDLYGFTFTPPSTSAFQRMAEANPFDGLLPPEDNPAQWE